MSARHLLVLCYFYPPLAGGGVHRVLGFTRHLLELGWRSTVVCASAEDYWVLDESLVAGLPSGVEVVRVPGGSALSALLKLRRGERGRRSGRWFAGLRKLSDWWLLPDSYRGWSRRAAARAGRLIEARRLGREGFDAVLSSSPPDSVHLAALELKRRFGLPWVGDFRDPWMGLAFRSPPTSWHRARQLKLEHSVLGGADVLLTASRTHAEMLARRSSECQGRMGRVVHLPNGYEPDPDASASATGDGVRAPNRVSSAGGSSAPTHERFSLVFTGTLSQLPDTLVFLDALHEFLKDRPEARRRLRVSLVGPYDSDYADRALALGLTGIVEFKGQEPHQASRALQRAADLLLLWKARGAPTMVPGKLYEYLDAGRPVLALLDQGDEAAELVARAGGSVVPPGDRVRLTEEIGRHYRAWRQGTPVSAARPSWLEEHTRARLTTRLAALLDGLVGATS